MIGQIATIIGIVVGIAGIVIPILLWRSSSKQKRLEKWEEEYKMHSQLIGRDIYQGFDRGYILASCEYSNGELIYHRPREPEVLKKAGIPYIEQARAHLQSGYPDLWALYKEAQDYSLEICEKIKTIVSSYEEKVLQTIEGAFPELPPYDKWSPQNLPTFYQPHRVLSAIFWEAFERSRGRSIGTFRPEEKVVEIVDQKGIKREMELTEVYFSGTGIARGERQTIKRLRLLIDDLMTNPEIQNLTKEYFRLKEQLAQNKAAEKLEKEIRDLWIMIQGGEKLKGSCDLCPPKPS
jgi:hypothetical protein